MTVGALWVRSDTHYRRLDTVCYDGSTPDLSAYRYRGPWPVVCHPPCGSWGRYAGRSVRHDPLDALAAIRLVRRWGGVLEHPAHSHLWRVAGLPRPGDPLDAYHGYTVEIRQCDWGHASAKRTWLYCVGVDLPPAPVARIQTRPVESLSHRQRELTPPALAEWLVAAAETADQQSLVVRP